jgi:hypothetical protein
MWSPRNLVPASSWYAPGPVGAGAGSRVGEADHGMRVFWDIHDPAKAIGIELRADCYTTLVVEVGNSEEQMRKIRKPPRLQAWGPYDSLIPLTRPGQGR